MDWSRFAAQNQQAYNPQPQQAPQQAAPTPSPQGTAPFPGMGNGPQMPFGGGKNPNLPQSPALPQMDTYGVWNPGPGGGGGYGGSQGPFGGMMGGMGLGGGMGGMQGGMGLQNSFLPLLRSLLMSPRPGVGLGDQAVMGQMGQGGIGGMQGGMGFGGNPQANWMANYQQGLPAPFGGGAAKPPIGGNDALKSMAMGAPRNPNPTGGYDYSGINPGGGGNAPGVTNYQASPETPINWQQAFRNTFDPVNAAASGGGGYGGISPLMALLGQGGFGGGGLSGGAGGDFQSQLLQRLMGQAGRSPFQGGGGQLPFGWMS